MGRRNKGETMKKVIVVLMCLCLTSLVFADNTDRIEELKTESTKLQANLQQAQQAVANIQVRLIQIQAILGELQTQDKEK